MSAAQQEAISFFEKFNKIILFPTITLLMAVAFFVFIWGCFEYFMNAENEQSRQQGARHITFGIIGLVVMVSAYAILQLAAGTFELNNELNCSTTGEGCDSAFVIPDAGGTPPGSNPVGGSPPGG